MTIKPIIMQPESVRAILDGRKTQTRRVLKPQPNQPLRGFRLVGHTVDTGRPVFEARSPANNPVNTFPIGDGLVDPHAPVQHARGDLLWVREAWCSEDGPMMWDLTVIYKADGHHAVIRDGEADIGDWLPPKSIADGGYASPLHMPRWASRLTLEVTAVRVERLQDISEADALAEGVTPVEGTHKAFAGIVAPIDQPGTHIGRFRCQWNRINARRGYSWDDNPWVVVIEFTPHRVNVDKLEMAEAV